MVDRLTGARILILETREEAQFSKLLSEQGAAVVQWPMFTIQDAPDPAPIEAWIHRAIDKPLDDLVLMTDKAKTIAGGFSIGFDPHNLTQDNQLLNTPKPVFAKIKCKDKEYSLRAQTVTCYADTRVDDPGPKPVPVKNDGPEITAYATIQRGSLVDKHTLWDNTAPATRKVAELAPELAAAGIVVTAGGVALLEACLLGRPIVALALAGNQRQAVFGLEREGAVVVATPETVANAVGALVRDTARRIELATAARASINGNGAGLVVDYQLRRVGLRGHLGFDVAGLDDRHLDRTLGVFGAQRFAERGHPRLAGGIGGPHSWHALVGEHR